MKAIIPRSLAPLKAFLELLLCIGARVRLVNPHPCWEELFSETVNVVLAKLGGWGHSGGGGWVWRRRRRGLGVS